jgi:hypothetical protein
VDTSRSVTSQGTTGWWEPRAKIALATLLFGVVYLFVITSRDVRHLTRVLPPLDERDERD